MVGARWNVSVVTAWKPDVVMLSDIWLGAMCTAVPANRIECVRSEKCVQSSEAYAAYNSAVHRSLCVLRASFLTGHVLCIRMIDQDADHA